MVSLQPPCIGLILGVCIHNISPVQVVIFLYLLDNDTSFVILASSGIGLLIEFWKVTKAMNVTLDRSGPNGPRLRFADKQGYNTTKTKQYDDEAMR